MSLKLIIKLLVIMILIATIILVSKILDLKLDSSDATHIRIEQPNPIEKNLIKMRGDHIA